MHRYAYVYLKNTFLSHILSYLRLNTITKKYVKYAFPKYTIFENMSTFLWNMTGQRANTSMFGGNSPLRSNLVATSSFKQFWSCLSYFVSCLNRSVQIIGMMKTAAIINADNFSAGQWNLVINSSFLTD